MSAPDRDVQRFGVVGHPIGHSLSPALHRAAYAALGLDHVTYDAFDVPAGALDAFLTDGPGALLDGVSVTMPGKAEAAAAAAVDADETTRLLGNANTLIRRSDGQWRAENHDVYGIQEALAGVGAEQIEVGAVVGSGATALSAVLALSRSGAHHVRLTARRHEGLTPHRDLATYLGMSVDMVAWDDAHKVLQADAVVSALALPGGYALAHAWADRDLPQPGAFLDVLYAPDPPPLAEVLAARGVRQASGLVMLAHQADMQLRSMVGIDAAPVQDMLTAARAEMAHHHEHP